MRALQHRQGALQVCGWLGADAVSEEGSNRLTLSDRTQRKKQRTQRRNTEDLLRAPSVFTPLCPPVVSVFVPTNKHREKTEDTEEEHGGSPPCPLCVYSSVFSRRLCVRPYK